MSIPEEGQTALSGLKNNKEYLPAPEILYLAKTSQIIINLF